MGRKYRYIINHKAFKIMVKYCFILFTFFSFFFIYSCGVDFSRNEIEKTYICGKITKKYLDSWNGYSGAY